MSLLGTSITGLRVAQTALNTTGNNISNAGVDGYSRQIVHAETNPQTRVGGFSVGNGARVVDIERQVNDFVSRQLRTDTTLYNELDSYQVNIAQLDRLLADASTGLSGAFENFFSSLQNASDDPTSIPARQLAVSQSEGLADRFNTLYARLTNIEDGINNSLSSATENANALVKNIAKLNKQISDSKGVVANDPNGLLDQRDQALKDLSNYISFQSYSQDFGEINLVIAGGQNLVLGPDSRELLLRADPNDSSKQQLILESDRALEPVPTSAIGGEIGGIFRFRDDALSETYNEVGRIATVLADTFNRAHATGLDLNNRFGRNVFSDINQRDISLNRVIGNSENKEPQDRLLSLDIVDSSKILATEYTVSVANDGLFTITRLSDKVEVAKGLLPASLPFELEFDGLKLNFERGTFQSGDDFSLQAVRTSARDFRSSILNPEDLAFGLPILTDATLGNLGDASITQGKILSLTGTNNRVLPLFSEQEKINPALLVRFTSESRYEVLNNNDPGRPIPLDPPIVNQLYTPGIENPLFSASPGETLVRTQGDFIGLPVGRIPSIGAATTNNGYPSEVITIEMPSSTSVSGVVAQRVSTSLHASARETADLLNNIDGINANASTYLELNDTQNLSLNSPLQLNVNGQDLIEYEFDAGLGTFVIASNVPDPATEQFAFNDYIVDRINANPSLTAQGMYANVARDAVSGADEVRIYSSLGDDLTFSLEAAVADSLNLNDGKNPSVNIAGNGAGTPSQISVGGILDLRLDDGIRISTLPPNSLLFGDSGAANFAKNTYLGIQATILGKPKVGDTFTIGFNENGASDNRNALNLVGLESSPTIDGSVSSYSEAYGALIETIGIDTASSAINRDAAKQVLDQSEELRNSISGVNLDEEAAQLIRFEQMYAANAQVISVARDLFDRLIGSF